MIGDILSLAIRGTLSAVVGLTFGACIYLGFEAIVRMIKRKINYFKRPKCPNGHRCPDCIHCDHVWEGIRFRGFRCRINAR